MRALVLLGVLLGSLLSPTTVRADDGLTAAVADAYFLRTVDAELHSIAHRRAAELAGCACLDHDGMDPQTAEVTAYNRGTANPVANAVAQWIDSAPHSAILSDPSYGRIGCAEVVSGTTHWFACVLAEGPLPAPVVGAAPVVALPNTALPIRVRLPLFELR